MEPGVRSEEKGKHQTHDDAFHVTDLIEVVKKCFKLFGVKLFFFSNVSDEHRKLSF